MYVSKSFAVGLAGCLFAVLPVAAAATVLVPGTGWQSDNVQTAGAVSDSSPFTFTAVAGAYQFSLTDAFKLGDTYTITLNGVDVFTTTPGLTATPFVNNLGPFAAFYAPAWTNADYSKIALQFGPGIYNFVVTGDTGGGAPASFGYRLDALVPEPASWALMLVGLGGLGAALRVSRRKTALATA